MEELKLTETVASQFERCDEPPYFRALQKTSSSQDLVSESRKNPVTPHDVTPLESETDGEGKVPEEVDGRKESREERKESKEERKEKVDSLGRNSIILHEQGGVSHVHLEGYRVVGSQSPLFGKSV